MSSVFCLVIQQKGKDRIGLDGEEESTLLEDSVSPAKATFMQHQSNKVGHASEGSVALPAVMRAGGSGMEYKLSIGHICPAVCYYKRNLKNTFINKNSTY